jgi:hypothetical protein
MPAHAFWLKKNRRWTAPISRTSDKEQALAPLRQPEKLCVQTCPRTSIPEFIHCSQEKAPISSFVGGQETGNVLEDEPTGFKSSNNSQGDEGQVAARVIQSEAAACDAKRLTGASENKDVWPSSFFRPFDEPLAIDVPQIGGLWVVMRHHGVRKLLYLGMPKPVPVRHCYLWSANPRKHGGSLHGAFTAFLILS